MSKRSAYKSASEILGKSKQKHKDWFDKNDEEANALLEE